ncbi:MAG: PQQ-like beta-propeller repeat protein [Methanomicrobiaceae archaeon]|nr:PQQ-like beta-propeller repeat protein [Methanomicrobiaceae archaeon]
MSSSGDLISAGSPETGILALISKDGTLVWAYQTELNISGVAISGNGEYISCVSEEGDVLLFDNSGNLLWKESINGCNPKTVLSEDGSICLVYNDDLPDDPYTQTLHVFDKNGAEFFSKRVPAMDSAGISSDGDYFFVGTSIFTRGRLYSKSGEVKWEYSIRQASFISANPRTSISDNLNLIGIVDLGRVIGFDISGNELFNESLAFLIGETPEFHRPTYYIDISGDGARLVTGSEFIVYCLNDTGSTLWSFEFEDAVSDDISSASISYDGGFVAASSGNNLYVLDENGDVLSKYDIDLPVKRVFISDDGEVIAGGATGGIVYLLSDETGLISVDIDNLSVQPVPTVGVQTQTPPETEQTAPVSFFLPGIALVITLFLQDRGRKRSQK